MALIDFQQEKMESADGAGRQTMKKVEKLTWHRSTKRPAKPPPEWYVFYTTTHSDDASWVECGCNITKSTDSYGGFDWRVRGWGWKFFGPDALREVPGDGRGRGKNDACTMHVSGHSETLKAAKRDCKAALKVLLETFKRMQERACGKNKTPKDEIVHENVSGVYTDVLAGVPLNNGDRLALQWPDGSMEVVDVEMRTKETDGGYDKRAIVVRETRGAKAVVSLSTCDGLKATRVQRVATERRDDGVWVDTGVAARPGPSRACGRRRS
jgi:hypothetical protein